MCFSRLGTNVCSVNRKLCESDLRGTSKKKALLTPSSNAGELGQSLYTASTFGHSRWHSAKTTIHSEAQPKAWVGRRPQVCGWGFKEKQVVGWVGGPLCPPGREYQARVGFGLGARLVGRGPDPSFETRASQSESLTMTPLQRGTAPQVFWER